MNFVLTEHAEKRAKERGISEKIIKEVLKNPTKIQRDLKNRNRILFKKLYLKKGSKRILLVVGEVEERRFKVITIVDTSKIKKYL